MAEQPFDVARFLDIPRLAGLKLSPGGDRLAVSVALPGPDRKRFRSSLWEVDPQGRRPARRLTRSAAGETRAAFLPDGSLLFTSARPDPDADRGGEDGEDRTGLWLLPASGGEARPVATPPGGVDDVVTAAAAGTVVLVAGMHPGAASFADDDERGRARRDAGVSARLLTGYPLRFWNRWLGPREKRVWAADPPAGDSGLDPRDLTPAPGHALFEVDLDVTPDGATVVTGWWRAADRLREVAVDLVALDVASGHRRVLLADGAWYSGVAAAPDSRRVAAVRATLGEPDTPGDRRLVVVDVDGGGVREYDLDVWPHRLVWTPDGSAVLFTADERGHHPVFRLDLGSGEAVRLTHAGAYTDVCVDPRGARAYALRATLARPPHPVAFDLSETDQEPDELPSPAAGVAGPGRVERVTASAEDGTEVASWLVLPPHASAERPAPLAVLIHGGPVASWTGWHWRWNPHLFTARGYAALLPDPALSTGYGRDFVARGWGRWGDEPYTDLMAAVEAVAARPDVDGGRAAALGGSFGGYMANWVAGRTDRFRAVVSHASVRDLREMHATSDIGVWLEPQFGDPDTDAARYDAHSPRRHVAGIATPTLVVHGERDYRCPVSEAAALWTDLCRHGAASVGDGVGSAFLYFPDEHHWIEKPQNLALWYDTVLAFLDHHVCGRAWTPPALL